jgi:alkylation response protein AidB-like acyl-CoA dehydrogenase
MTALVAPWPEADPSIMTPIAEHADLRDSVRSLLARSTGPALWSRLNDEIGVGAMLVPEALGGAGFGLRDVAVILEESGAALVPEPILFSAVLAAAALSGADDPTSVQDLLAGLVSGTAIGTVCLDAPDLTVDASRLTGTLRRVAAGSEADVVVVRSADGLHAVPLHASGVVVRALEVMDATRPQAEIALDAAESVLLSDGDVAARQWERLGRLATIASAAEHVGIIGRQLAATVEYVGQRHQFGRPIGSFQAVKHRLADVAVDLERARSAVAYAAALHDEDPDARLPAAVAGAVATDAVIRAVHEAVQLHGGIGFTWEHSAHLYVRRALGDEGLFGSARRHREDVANLVVGR